MSRAILYLTYNGVFNNTNGIGTQTKTFLSGMERHYEHLQAEFGPFAVHLLSQVPHRHWWGYSEADLAEARRITAACRGAVHFCPYLSYADDFWTPRSWLALSAAAAGQVLNLAASYDETFVIANDIPFLHTPLVVERARQDFGVNVRSLIALYGSSYVHLPLSLDWERLAWEQLGIASAAQFERIKLAHFSDFMRDHFIKRYGAGATDFLPYRSSLNLGSAEFQPLPTDEVLAVLRRYSIPLDRPLVVAFGRADWIKGFDILLEGLGPLRDRVHLVLNVVPYADDLPILAEYRSLIARQQLSCTLLTAYSRELPRALCQWEGTRAVVCPSRGEPLSNIPFEVSLWARDRGPTLLCTDLDGFREQIDDGVNGFLFDPHAPTALAEKLQAILDLRDSERECIRARAYERVVAERNFFSNFRETLLQVWRPRQP